MDFKFWDSSWFAMDSIGHLGHFKSAGSQYVPKYYWARAEILESIYDLILSRPNYCRHILVYEKNDFSGLSDWTVFSDRGMYSYDFDVNSVGTYDIVSIPETPVHVSLVDCLPRELVPIFPGVFTNASIDAIQESVIDWLPNC